MTDPTTTPITAENVEAEFDAYQKRIAEFAERETQAFAERLTKEAQVEYANFNLRRMGVRS